MALVKSGNSMVKSLGSMVELLLSLYVFDQIIAVVLPLAYNCPERYTANVSVGTGTVGACYKGDGGLSNQTTSPSYFGTALSFTKNLFPVIAIMGTFEIVYRGLRTSGMI